MLTVKGSKHNKQTRTKVKNGSILPYPMLQRESLFTVWIVAYQWFCAFQGPIYHPVICIVT